MIREKVKSLYEKGLSQRKIASELEVSRGRVRHYLDKLQIQRKALIFNDLHIPFHDPKAVELTLKVGEMLDPHVIVINGDLGDFWEISKFVKHASLLPTATLSKEIEMSKQFLKNLRKRFPDADIHYIFGNHEYRWDVHIDTHAREFVGLKGMSLAEQLELDSLDIEHHYTGIRESSWLWGKLLIGHFNKVSKHSGYTAKMLLEEKGISLLQAHTHRGGTHYKRVYDDILVAHENFCLCDINPCYLDRPNWQQGFSIVYRDAKSDLFWVEPHPIVKREGKYRVFFNGKVIEV